MSNKSILWALHVQGPDDVYAAPSWAGAAEAATYLEYHMTQSRLRKEPDLPAVSFAVIPWPHSPESHAKDVLRWLEHYPGQPASAQETSPLCPHGWPLADNTCGPCSEGAPNTWRCSICSLLNPADATHCRQCEYSRTIMKDGRRWPRDGQR